jgi:hypothetical protein
MTNPLIITYPANSFRQRPRQERASDVATGRVPRLARLLALAIKFHGLVRAGAIRNQADLARLGHVSRARISQIMNLLSLATDIQEEILWLPSTKLGRDPINLRQVQPIALVLCWKQQRRLWQGLKRRVKTKTTSL